jgi:RHS repeat-associated protein
MQNAFTHWWSTKPWDPVTGLSEYQFRMYSPELGRWVNRDPIGERGGLAVYVFTFNCSLSIIDLHGMIGLEAPGSVNHNNSTYNKAAEGIPAIQEYSSIEVDIDKDHKETAYKSDTFSAGGTAYIKDTGNQTLNTAAIAHEVFEGALSEQGLGRGNPPLGVPFSEGHNWAQIVELMTLINLDPNQAMEQYDTIEDRSDTGKPFSNDQYSKDRRNELMAIGKFMKDCKNGVDDAMSPEPRQVAIRKGKKLSIFYVKYRLTCICGVLSGEYAVAIYQ